MTGPRTAARPPAHPGVSDAASATARSTGGLVTTPHHLATTAGVDVLRRGGNAIEAVVAAGAALSVLYPHFCGLGGDAVWLISDATGQVDCVLGIGQAAAALPAVSGAIPPRGAGSTLTTAALVDSWAHVLGHSAEHWHGRFDLTTLLDAAIGLAEDGFPVSRSQGFWHRYRADDIATWSGVSTLFQADGRQRQPALARTLRALARHGARDFYDGELASRIAAGLAAAGSPLTAADLAATTSRRVAPLALDYRGLTLLAPPPPTQGVTTLQIMGLLAHQPVASFAPATADFYHHLVEAVKLAFLDRQHVADPDFITASFADWLDPQHLATRARAIDAGRARPWPHRWQTGDTAFLAAVDADGRAVSMLQSLYYDWGSGVLVGDTGILWQNRGAGFSVDPTSPNRLQPGKRPFYTLTPGIALKDGRPHLVYGTQGADGQPQTLALLLSLLIDHGLDPMAALSRPRFLLGRTFSDGRDTLKIEAGLDDGALAELAARGHELAPLGALDPLAGQAGILQRHADGHWIGAHDPRSDGGALAV